MSKTAAAKTTSTKATAMVVAFDHAADARAYNASLRACGVVATVEGRDVVVALTSASNNEIARNLASGRVFYK